MLDGRAPMKSALQAESLPHNCTQTPGLKPRLQAEARSTRGQKQWGQPADFGDRCGSATGSFFEIGRQSPFSPQTKTCPAGDAEFFDVGEEVGDDVVGVGGVEEARGGEVGCQEAEQGGEVLRASVDGGELHQKRREAEGVATAPDFERQDFVDESAGSDVADLLIDVGLEPGVEARLPKDVTCITAASGDQVDESTFVQDSHGNIADVAVKVIGKRGLHGGERSRSDVREAEEDVDIAVFEVGAFGVGAGEGDGLEILVITPAAK